MSEILFIKYYDHSQESRKKCFFFPVICIIERGVGGVRPSVMKCEIGGVHSQKRCDIIFEKPHTERSKNGQIQFTNSMFMHKWHILDMWRDMKAWSEKSMRVLLRARGGEADQEEGESRHHWSSQHHHHQSWTASAGSVCMQKSCRWRNVPTSIRHQMMMMSQPWYW